MVNIIGTHPNSNKIYYLNGTNWDEFLSQPGATGLADGIWGGPNNTIWTHNRQTSSNSRYLFFNGSSWSEYVGPSTSNRPVTIHGSADGAYVYAACQFEIHKWDGVSWSVVANTWRARNIWCDETGQHVWTTGGHDIGLVEHIYYSDDWGSSWTDVYPGALADLGLSAAYAPIANGIWGLSPTEIYINWGWGFGAVPPALEGNAGGISLYNGSSWSWVAQSAGNDYLMQQDGSVWADGAGVYVCNGGWAYESIHIASGGSLVRKVTAADHNQPYGRNVIGIPGTVVVVALDGKLISDPSDQFVSFDDGDTWQQTTYPWSGSTGLASLSLYGWTSDTSPPVLQNQDPYPNETSVLLDYNISFDVVDEYGGVNLSTLDAYVDGSLAFDNGAFQAPYNGIDAYVGAIQYDNYDGYTFIIDNTNLWTPLAQVSVRVVAEDLLGNSLDETWYFYAEPQPYSVSIDIEEGYGSGFSSAYDGTSFVSPYNNGSYINKENDGYNFVIRKQGLLDLGRVSVSVSVEGYASSIYEVSPQQDIDVSRSSEIKFRVVK